MSPMVMAMMAILAQNASKWSILTILATIAILNGNMCMTMTNIHFSSAKNLRGKQVKIKGEKPPASPVDLRDAERQRRGGASEAGRGGLREKGIVKKKVVTKTTSPKKRWGRRCDNLFFSTDFAARPPPARGIAKRHRVTMVKYTTASGLKYPK